MLCPHVVKRWEVFTVSFLLWDWQPGEFPETWTEIAPISEQTWMNICLRVCSRNVAGLCPFASSLPLCVTKIKTYNYKNKNKKARLWSKTRFLKSLCHLLGVWLWESYLMSLSAWWGDNNSTCIQGMIKMLRVKFLVQCLTQQALEEG